jgi:hypothetical protein
LPRTDYEEWDDDPDAPLEDDLDDSDDDDDASTDCRECPSCGALIYEFAEQCPKCGDWIVNPARVTTRPAWVKVVALVLVGAFVVVLLIGLLRSML